MDRRELFTKTGRAARLGAQASASLASDARTRRLVGMLARKGYAPGLAFAVVREVLASEGDMPDDPGP